MFAVVDLETTGLHPGYHHRVLEVAVVAVGGGGQVEDEWTTLINPERDLGPTGIHGVVGADVNDAPRFGDVAGEILERLRGRVPVAHNARFDAVFLEAEFSRLGIDISTAAWSCTLALSAPLVGAARLRDCCAWFGVDLLEAHTALGDARGCAAVLCALLDRVSPHVWPPASGGGWPYLDRARWTVTRDEARSRPPAESFIGSLAARLDQQRTVSEGRDQAAELGYLQVLDRALADRRVSEEEVGELGAVAELYRLDVRAVQELHGRYVAGLLDLALADAVITEREQRDLELVAALLGVDFESVRTPGPPVAASGAERLVGKTVCFTGALCCTYEGEAITRQRAEHLATRAGMIVAPRVTRSLEVLVVADPASLSAKARKAREYGTTVIAEAAFWPLIGVEVN